MGCFLSCFRGGSHTSADLQDPLVRESSLGDAFLDDEKKFEATGALDAEVANDAGVDEELRREANYLKSCGTISQTPPEILDSVQINSEDANELMKDAALLEENSLEVLNSDEHDILKHEQNIDEGTPRKDTLRHEQNTEEDTLRVDSETQSSLQDKPSCQNVRDQSTDSIDSPYPTPLILRGDIQTPGTVYSTYKETSKPGKRTRASRQFIYPVLRPIENKMQWMELKAESPVLSSNPPKRRNLSAVSSEKSQQMFASSTVAEAECSEYVSFPVYDNCTEQNEVMSSEETKGQNLNQQLYEGEGELLKQNSEYGKHGVTSLSCWLKPSSADDETNSNPDCNVGKEPWYETSVSDVPVFPAFGLNWESDDPTPVLPKAWDGNGIPNTTTKYKEDQKVSWQATPFEERLLKVLSDEKPHHERKISGKLIHLDENAE